VIRDFAAIGYDQSNLSLQSYDWRLSLHDLERRDHYFTLLMWKIEGLVKMNRERVVLIAHRYGGREGGREGGGEGGKEGGVAGK